MKRLIAIAVALLAAAAPHATAQDFPPALVVTEPVTTREFHDQLTLIGRSQAIAQSRIVAEVSGVVLRIDAAEGRWVERGGRLVSIDPRRLQLVLQAKIAETKQAKASAELAERTLGRAQNMYDQELLAEQGLDDNLTDQRRAIERYNQLKAELEQLELDLVDCSIVAPYSGYTVRQLVQIGEWVNRGTPVYEFVDLSVVKVIVDLPERNFGQVAIGSSVAIQVSGGAGEPVMGVVNGIAPQASETTHTFPVIVTVDNKDGRLGSGMLVRATLSLKNKFESLAVSKDAIIRQGNNTIVYTVIEGKAAPIPVMIGSSDGVLVAVQGEGLVDGMPVIVRGNERIFPGSPVQTPGGQPGEEPAEEPAGDHDAASGSR